jgi:hypothetical protein
MTLDTPLIYRSYLLRLWQAREEADLTWRAMLADVKTGEQRGFASLEELMAYLRQVTDGSLVEDET